jgi:hypothetical protein
MTQEQVADSIAEAPVTSLPSVGRKQISVEEIADSFQCVRMDIEDIGKLTSEENLAVNKFFGMLHESMQLVTSSIDVSTSVLPPEIIEVTQACLDPAGQLMLTFEDGHREVKDLSEFRNRDLLVAVMEDVLPKFEALTIEFATRKLRKVAMDFLNKNVNDLANEIAKLKMFKTSNPLKKSLFSSKYSKPNRKSLMQRRD